MRFSDNSGGTQCTSAHNAIFKLGHCKSGDVWPETERKLWLQLLEGSFKLIYKDKESDHLPSPPRDDEFRKAQAGYKINLDEK
jgi:hypothetical protein